MNNNQYYQEYLRLIAEEQAKQQQENDPITNAKNAAAKIGSYGDKLSTVGDAINNYVNTPTAQTIGSKISALGGNITNGANTVSNTLNAPQNYFKGFANRTIGTGLQNAGNYLAQKTGLANTIGTGMQKLGASIVGNTAATTGATAAGAGATGAAAGTGAAASGGAAAGGAGAAAFSNPVTALAALGTMAAMGANRNRAKKGGQALLNSTDQEVNQGADNALTQTQQNAANLQAQSQEAFNNGIITGGAAPVQQQLTPIQEYQEYLRGQGYSDDIVNGVPQGLNGGNKDIADWINQYNAGTGKDNPINIPQTDEEIAAAKAGTFNNLQTGNAIANVKQGILDKFINGIADLSKGYQENKENAFKPENLVRDDSKNKMTKIGEVAGTISRAAQKPAVQAILAGGLSAALTGNPLYGLGQAYKFGSNRANTKIYQEALKKQGIDADTGMLGNLSSRDMDALMKPQYKAVEQQMANELLKERIRHNQEMENHYKMIDAARQQNANTNEYKAKNGTTVKHVGGSGGSKSKKTPKVTDHPDWNQDLADFSSVISNPRYAARADEAKARFIKKHGVDPMKYIKF